MKSKTNRILIVDDDPEFRSSLSKILQKAGYEVIAAAGGQEACEIISQEFYPVIFLDVHLPGKSGLQVLNEIKEKSPRSKVIMISVDGNLDIYHLFVASGVFAFLSKPAKREEIVNYARLAFEK